MVSSNRKVEVAPGVRPLFPNEESTSHHSYLLYFYSSRLFRTCLETGGFDFSEWIRPVGQNGCMVAIHAQPVVVTDSAYCACAIVYAPSG